MSLNFNGNNIGGTPSGGGGTPYILPIASENTLGGVKIDGETITITNEGVISSQGGGSVTVDSELSSSSTNPVQNKVINSALNDKQDVIDASNKLSANYVSGLASVATSGDYADLNNGYSLPTASTSTLGGVKVDGSTITINDGVISSQGGGGTSDHSQLTNLDYANSGHTGFMSASNHIEPSTIISVGNGKNYTTIQAAINSLNRKWCEGTVTIQIDSGVFNEQITLSGSNNMIKTLRIVGSTNGTTEIHYEPLTDWSYIFLVGNQPNINLSNLTISSTVAKNNTGLQLVNSLVYLQNIAIENVQYCGVQSTFNSVVIHSQGNLTITNTGTTQGSKAISIDSSKFIFGGGAPTTINNFSEGISSSKGGVCSLNSNSMPTFTSVTTQYTPALNNMTTGTGWNVSGY